MNWGMSQLSCGWNSRRGQIQNGGLTNLPSKRTKFEAKANSPIGGGAAGWMPQRREWTNGEPASACGKEGAYEEEQSWRRAYQDGSSLSPPGSCLLVMGENKRGSEEALTRQNISLKRQGNPMRTAAQGWVDTKVNPQNREVGKKASSHQRRHRIW
jgi:hypothetical protein